MKFWQVFGHHVNNESANDELRRYRLVGGQVLEVLDQLKNVPQPKAHAYIEIARCLELFADTLVDPYLSGEQSPKLPEWIQNQSVHLYRPIPPLVTAAKQEAIDPDGTRDIDLPWILKGRVPGADHEGVEVFRHYVEAVKAVIDHCQVLIGERSEAKQAHLYFAEATTNYDSGRYLLSTTQEMSRANKRSLDDYLWTALGYVVGAVQEASAPGLLNGMDIDTMLESADATLSQSHTPTQAQPIRFLDAVQEIANNWDQNQYSYRDWEHHEHHHDHHDDHEHHHHEHHHTRWDD